ncbi:hypothetical protein JB92DRAFT_3262983 [Gautieria morchelliformis]|nr:hypothetical protein JB92DRAFT_3262983 [Gautieria morchelliformis]
MLAFMKGKAVDFFMTFVALDIKLWMVDSLGQALFNYCFPPVENAYKGLLCQLKSMAVHLPNITEFQLIQKYWDGAETCI